MSRARNLADVISGGFDIPAGALDNVPQITSSAITSALGYTPVNKAGDTVSGTLAVRNISSTQSCSPASPLGSIQGGASLVYVSGVQTDNAWRTIVSGFNDFNGFIFACIGDQPVRDTGIWQASTPSPAYGVFNFSSLHYSDNGWPSGTFNLRRNTNGNTHELQIQHSSYYSSSNEASGYLLFLKLS